ncbi:MAG: histidine kinase [Bacteroidales bacterium]|nr:histidine kinase [Bacteroidales bacterium]
MKMNDTNVFLSVKSYMVWLILLLFYFILGVQSSTINALFHALLFTGSQYLVFTINDRYLIPTFYETNKRRFYNDNFIIITTISLVITSTIYIAHHFSQDYRIPRPQNFFFPFIVQMILCGIAFWVSTSKYLLKKEEKTKIEIEELKREKVESELRFLKTQINPHFLFNALNNIYSMAYSGDQTAPEKIAILSDMLRYVLYDCESNSISLDKEIDYISNYIEFQQLKTESKQNIRFDFSRADQSYQVAPMLLVPFVENAFKHSSIEKDPEGFVDIELYHQDNMLVFIVRNSIPQGVLSLIKSGREKGIGIENVRHRLNLIYNKKYFLLITKNEKEHCITLTLTK